jgi:SAM-dependent methyltransferase
MPDVYATIAEAQPGVQEELARILELRAAVPRQREMRAAYFAKLELPKRARVLEVGCGTGPVSRALAELVPDGSVVGVDPSPVFLERARELAAAHENLSFAEGDARSLPLDDRSFDAVVFHTTLCHVPESERALAEAYRVLAPGGRLVVFDGDYATTTVALGDLTRSRRAPRPSSPTSSTTAGSSGACPGSCGQPGSRSRTSRATGSSRRTSRSTCSRS